MKRIRTLVTASTVGATLLLTSSVARSQDEPAPEAPTSDAPTAPPDAKESVFAKRMDAVIARANGLTADTVAKRAAGTSARVMASRAELAAASAQADRALAAYIPKVTLTARYTRLSDMESESAGSIVSAPTVAEGPIPPGTQLFSSPLSFPTIVNQYTFQAGISVPVSDYFLRVAPQNAAASRSEASAAASVQTSERQAAADARTAYYAWVRARLGVVVAEQALEQSRGHLEDAKKGLDVGNASPADVLRIESQLARSELLLESSKNLDRLTELQLRVAMHDRGVTPYVIGEDIRQNLAPITAGDTDKLAAEAFERRPEAKSLREAAAAQRKLATVERAGMFPRFDLFANAYYSNPNSRSFPQTEEFKGSWDAGAQLTWTISDLPGAYSAGKAEEAKALALDAQRSQIADSIRLEVFSAVQDVREADLGIETTERGLASAEESYRVRKLLFENGKATSTELLDAETEVTRARLDALGARIDARIARVRLAYATGEDV